MSKDYDLKLDVKRPNYERLCGFKTGDNLAIINGSMLQNSMAYDLTGLALRVNFEDSNGNVYFQDASKGVSIVNPKVGTFKINLLSSVLSVPGMVKSDISIFKGAQKLTSSTFIMMVEDAIYNDGAITGEDGKDLLQEIIDGESERVNSEKVRKTNELGRESSELKRKANEIVREANESKRKVGYSKMDTRIDNLVLGQGSQTEVVDARLDGISNELYPTLKARLDASSKQLFDSSLTDITTSKVFTKLDNAEDGIMQVDSIKGNTLKNEIVNGGFYEGIKGWSTSDSVVDFTVPNQANLVGNGTQRHISLIQFKPSTLSVKNHIFYSKASVKIRKVGALANYSLSLELRDTGLIVFDSINSNVQDVWHTLSGISKPLIGYESPYFRVLLNYDTPEMQKNRTMQIEKVLMIDLTQTFGEGKEPSKEWCDENLPYFDGIKSTGEFEGRNLFDKTKITNGNFLKALDGVVTPNSNGCYSDYIKVMPNFYYTISIGLGSETYGHCFYNSSKGFIKGVISSSGGKQTLITPSNAMYIRLSSLMANVDNQQLEEGGEATQYVPYQGYKIDVLSIGKNILAPPKEDIVKSSFNVIQTLKSNGVIVLNGTSTASGGRTIFRDVAPTTKLMGGKQYCLTCNIVSGSVNGSPPTFHLSSKGDDSNFMVVDLNRKTTINITKDTQVYCGVNVQSGSAHNNLTINYQLEEGLVDTPYEPYEQDKYKVQLKDPLKGLSNGVSDEIIGDRIYRRVGKTILNGSETWTLEQNHTTNLGFYHRIGKSRDFNRTKVNTISTPLPSISISDLLTNNNIEGVGMDFNNAVLRVSILKSKLTTLDVAGFKKWLTENPTEVYYEVGETTSSINPSSLKSFKDGSIILNNLITPSVSLKYPTSIVGRLSSVESTLDDTVDRIRKLEEALFVVTAELLEARKKMVYIGYATLNYFNGASGTTKVYKNMQLINVQLEINFQEEPSQNRLHYATVQEGFRPISNIMNEITDATGAIIGILEIETDGKFYIRRKGSLSAKFFRGNITYMTAE